ncbi:hypothetical protein WBG06_09635 [Nocardioides sp. CCNWLW239]|uniref:hypothetical protein n=1 Tax=Nocardioides sp. CCNWLW239 TaxID=3128902 RepID=UPI0030172775
MEQSPKGRTIRPVDGEPGAISKRGQQIETLGEMMLNSALVLQNIADNALGGESMKGKAINALRDSIGDSHETLKQAGELYKPVGPVIKAYGDALEEIQPKIETAVNEAQDRYSKYIMLPGDKDDSQTEEEGGLLGIGGTDKEEAAENQAKAQAYQDFVEKATEFDAHYDTWEEAFETAANGIEDRTAGSIEDSAWSDWADVLKVVGTIVAIAALCTGIGALVWLGVGIGLLATAATVGQVMNGEAGWLDVGIAALSIIPVTKAGNVAGSLGRMSLTGEKLGVAMLKNSMPSMTGLLKMTDDSLIGAWKAGGLSTVGKFLATGSTGGRAGVADGLLAKSIGMGPMTLQQTLQVSSMSKYVAGGNGIGNVLSLNSWAGNLGFPSVDVPDEVGLVF